MVSCYQLSRLINGQFRWRGRIGLNAYVAEATRVIAQALPSANGTGDRKHQIIEIDCYQGRNSHVHRMMDYLNSHNVWSDVVGVFVHGSLGIGDEVAYSDFDALVIVKSATLKDPRRLGNLAHLLSAARRIMFTMDPLQHHGWFALNERELACYPDHYLPIATLELARSLAAGESCKLRIVGDFRREEHERFWRRLSAATKQELSGGQWTRSLYDLKCTLSKFLLLPAAFLQTNHGQGVSKRCSFEMARRHFEKQDWSIMDRVSALRIDWRQDLSPVTRAIAKAPGRLRRVYLKRMTPIPASMKLSSDDVQRMLHLISSMDEQLQADPIKPVCSPS